MTAVAAVIPATVYYDVVILAVIVYGSHVVPYIAWHVQVRVIPRRLPSLPV